MRYVWLLGMLFAGVLCAQQRPRGTVVVGELGERLEAAVAAAAPDYWGTVLVASGGRPVFVRGYGPADREPPRRGRKPKAMDHECVFDLGGASQQLTALLALRLQADGKLSLDDPIGKHLDDWPKDKQAMTVDQLLLHTSGMPRRASWPKGAAKGVRSALAVLAGARLQSAPGAEFGYSVLNANLLAIVLEEAAGQRFDKLLEERVLKPFGMSGADHANGRFPARLVTVRRKADGTAEPANRLDYTWRVRGARGVLASVHDVHALLGGILAGGLLDRRERELLWRPLVGPQLKIRRADVGAIALRRIEGFDAGFQTRWTVHDASKSWVVLCTDQAAPLDRLEAALVTELAATLAAAPPTPEPPTPEPFTEPERPAPEPTAAAASELDRFTGTFELPAGGRFRIARDGAALRLFGEGAQASVRLVEGVWPGLLGAVARRSEDRGIALLERLVRGDATVVGEAFADAAAARAASTALAGFVAGHGAFDRAEFVGTALPRRGVVESWYRLVCTGGAATVRVSWRDERRFATCALSTEPPPFSVEVAVTGPDRATARSAGGQVLALTVEGRGDGRTLVFEDGTPGDDGLLECALVPAAPR